MKAVINNQTICFAFEGTGEASDLYMFYEDYLKAGGLRMNLMKNQDLLDPREILFTISIKEETPQTNGEEK